MSLTTVKPGPAAPDGLDQTGPGPPLGAATGENPIRRVRAGTLDRAPVELRNRLLGQFGSAFTITTTAVFDYPTIGSPSRSGAGVGRGRIRRCARAYNDRRKQHVLQRFPRARRNSGAGNPDAAPSHGWRIRNDWRSIAL